MLQEEYFIIFALLWKIIHRERGGGVSMVYDVGKGRKGGLEEWGLYG